MFGKNSFPTPSAVNGHKVLLHLDGLSQSYYSEAGEFPFSRASTCPLGQEKTLSLGQENTLPLSGAIQARNVYTGSRDTGELP